MSEQANKAPAKLNKFVFLSSSIIIILFVFFATVFTEKMSFVLASLQQTMVNRFGWFYLLSVAIFLFFSIGLAASSYGTIKLGPEHSEPDFSYSAWFAMLFSAGMGIGLLFFGVAEPIEHYLYPPVEMLNEIEAAQQAMSITFFHWGVHAWAIYAIVGLSLAYFGFRHGLPMSMRSALFPIIGDRAYGITGDIVDVFAIIGTVFGVATTLGLGVMQMQAGITFMFGVPEGHTLLLGLIGVITLFAIISVVMGLDGGMRRLSELNLVFAVLLMAFVLFSGPTWKLLQFFVENIGNYLNSIVKETFTLYAYNPTEWIGNWTLFYWAWWISWSPFVGMFIARVSRGRTIREYLIGVLFVPAGFTFIWMTIFGNTAIAMQMADVVNLGAVVADDMPLTIFVFLNSFPWGNIASYVALLLITTFFITSMDSGSLVIDMIGHGGSTKTRVVTRIFWALTFGILAAVLIILGGLEALQAVVLVGAFPFIFVMLLICAGLLRGLQMESLRQRVSISSPQVMVASSRASWEKRLRAIINHPRYEKVKEFVAETATPALKRVAAELKKQKVKATLAQADDHVRIEVHQGEEINFIYKVQLKSYTTPSFAFPRFENDEDKQKKYCRAEVHLLEGNQYYDIMGYTIEEVIEDVLSQYDKHMQFLHLADQ